MVYINNQLNVIILFQVGYKSWAPNKPNVWSPNEPNDWGKGGQDCVQYVMHGKHWEDVSCSYKRPYVCQKLNCDCSETTAGEFTVTMSTCKLYKALM